MSRTQTDIRTTSYDELAARPFGYQGTIDEVIEQMRAEPETQHRGPRGRNELLHFLGVKPSVRPLASFSRVQRALVEMERDSLIPPPAPKQPWDGLSPFSLEYAMARWPENFTVPRKEAQSETEAEPK